jgi:outer membrane receptor protein involved in Fe transport
MLTNTSLKAIHLSRLIKSVLLMSLWASLPFQVQAASANEAAMDKIEVISISAAKKSQMLSEVPSSVSVVNRETLERIEAQHINQVLSRVAGTWISRGNGQEHLTAIRSPVLTGPGGCGAFFMALDGISLRAPGFCNTNQLFDANTEQAGRIEVLKGPASTLYGTNALHGAINIISQDAFANNENRLGLQLGAYDFARVSGQFNWQTQTQALSLLTNLSQENGFQTMSGYDQQKATLIYQQRGATWNNKTLIDIANLNQETAGFIRGFKAYADNDIRKINPNPEAFRDAQSLRAYSQFTRALGDGKLSITPYMRWNDMQFLQHYLPWQALEQNNHTSLGLQAQYDADLIGANWISGLDIDVTQGNLSETQAQPFSPNIPAGEHYDYDVDATSIAAYTQANWQWQNLAIILGGRIERTEYDYNNLLSNGSACAPEVAVCRFSRPPDQSLTFTNLSPSATIEYQLSANWLSYIKYSQGFRAPEATELFRLQDNQISTDFEEVSLDAFEIGSRFSIDNHALHIAAYDMQKDNVIIRDTNRQNIAGGETAHQGLEIEYRWQISSQLQFATNLTWQKHTYETDLAVSNTSIKGNRVDTSPNQLYAAQLYWQASEKARAELSWQYLSAYYLDPENTAEYEGHSLLDFSLSYAISDTISAKINLLNLSDEDYAERADFAFGGYRYFVGQPRRAFFSVQWIL